MPRDGAGGRWACRKRRRKVERGTGRVWAWAAAPENGFPLGVHDSSRTEVMDQEGEGKGVEGLEEVGWCIPEKVAVDAKQWSGDRACETKCRAN